jgi:DNA-binding IclR family transcriptional regulator
MRLLVDYPDGLSLGEIADRTALARSTVQRIVKALSDEQFLVPASNRGGVKLGHGLIPLANGAKIEISEIARPLMMELAQIVLETVDLSIFSDTSALFVAQIPGSHRLAAVSSVGEAFPLHSTANGKALLACLTEERQNRLLARKLSQDTSKTCTDRKLIRSQLKDVVSSGLAFDIEEHTDGICAIGTAFIDTMGRPHAISIPVPKSRWDKKHQKLGAPLLACREKLVAKIGGSLPPLS